MSPRRLFVSECLTQVAQGWNTNSFVYGEQAWQVLRSRSGGTLAHCVVGFVGTLLSPEGAGFGPTFTTD